MKKNESWVDVKIQLKELIEHAQVSEHVIIKGAGLNRSTYYKIFAPDRLDASMRKGTVYAIANELGVRVHYENNLPQFSYYSSETQAIYEEQFGPLGDQILSEAEMKEALSKLSGGKGFLESSDIPPQKSISLTNISDQGLRTLLSEDNVKKYRIYYEEATELMKISTSHKSNSTVDQWLAVLFAVRGLDTN